MKRILTSTLIRKLKFVVGQRMFEKQRKEPYSSLNFMMAQSLIVSRLWSFQKFQTFRILLKLESDHLSKSLEH